MNKKISKIMALLLIVTMMMSITAFAEGNDSEIEQEQLSFSEYDGSNDNIGEIDQYVDGIYNIGENARASMSGVIRLYQSGTKLATTYSTAYTKTVDRIGVKNIKLQYKGSLGLWHDIITIDDRYRTNDAAYQGGFSCSGVIGRTYRMKGTHYIIDGSYKESRNNVTDGLTFR